MKKQLKKFLSRISKLHKRYGDVIGDEIKEARKYRKIKRRSK